MCILYVDYGSTAVGQICTMWHAYLFGAYANTVKCMYSSASDHIVDCNTSCTYKDKCIDSIMSYYMHTNIHGNLCMTDGDKLPCLSAYICSSIHTYTYICYIKGVTITSIAIEYYY